MDQLAMQWQFVIVAMGIAVGLSAVWMYFDARR